jgi:hypothetical protein
MGETIMSESDITTDVPETQTETETVTEKETAPVDLQAELDKWKAMSRKNEERAKANETAAKRLSEIEESQKTEIEKALARAEEAERRASAIELEATRNQVALSKGLTPSQAKRLVGTTLEELEADADDLLADLKASKPAKAPSSDGQGAQGEKVGTGKQIVSRDQLKTMTRQEINQAREDGRLDSLLGIQ